MWFSSAKRETDGAKRHLRRFSIVKLPLPILYYVYVVYIRYGSLYVYYVLGRTYKLYLYLPTALPVELIYYIKLILYIYIYIITTTSQGNWVHCRTYANVYSLRIRRALPLRRGTYKERAAPASCPQPAKFWLGLATRG